MLTPGPTYRGSIPPVEAVYLDIDNTLVPNQSNALPSKRFTDVCKKVGKKIPIAFATARPLSKVLHLFESTEARGLSILSNGAQIYDSATETFVREWMMPADAASEIAMQIRDMEISFWINDNGVDFFRVSDEYGNGAFATPSDIWNDASDRIAVPEYAPSKPFVIVAHNVGLEQVQGIHDIAARYADVSIGSFIAHETTLADSTVVYDIFIADSRANKKDALNEALSIQHISMDNVLFIGDGHNDAVLIEAAGVGVAMGNAVQEAKNVAKFIAPALVDDGAAVALEELCHAESPPLI